MSNMRLFDGCNTVAITVEALQRFFEEPNDTWQGIQLSIMHGEDSLAIYRVDEVGLPTRARGAGTKTRGQPLGFLLGAGRKGSPRAPSQGEPVVARSWDSGAETFLFSSAFMLSAKDAFAVASHFARTGEMLDAIGRRKLEWSDAWIAVWSDTRFGAWNDLGEMRANDGHDEEEEEPKETPLDRRSLDWDLKIADDEAREPRGVLSLSFVARPGIRHADLTALRRTAHWELLRALDIDSDEAWLAALAEQPMCALRRLTVSRVPRLQRLTPVVAGHAQLQALEVMGVCDELSPLHSASLRRLVVRSSSTWARASLRAFLTGMEVPALAWLVLPGELVTAGLDFSALPERACLVIDAATTASIEASSSAPNVWLRSTADDVTDDALLDALVKARSGQRRTHLPLGADDEVLETGRARGLRVW